MANSFKVSVRLIPGEKTEYNLTEPTTVAKAKGFAVVDPGKWTAQIKGTTVPDDQVIDSDTKIVLIPKVVKGNAA